MPQPRVGPYRRNNPPIKKSLTVPYGWDTIDRVNWSLNATALSEDNLTSHFFRPLQSMTRLPVEDAHETPRKGDGYEKGISRFRNDGSGGGERCAGARPGAEIASPGHPIVGRNETGESPNNAVLGCA